MSGVAYISLLIPKYQNTWLSAPLLSFHCWRRSGCYYGWTELHMDIGISCESDCCSQWAVVRQVRNILRYEKGHEKTESGLYECAQCRLVDLVTQSVAMGNAITKIGLTELICLHSCSYPLSESRLTTPHSPLRPPSHHQPQSCRLFSDELSNPLHATSPSYSVPPAVLY